MRIAALLLAAALVPAAALSGDEPGRAEYAVRWDPSQGGPANVRELLDFLGASEGGGHAYEVRYFDLPRPEGAPAGATPILRLRIADGGDAEVRLKYRMEQPLEGRWGCPAGARSRRAKRSTSPLRRARRPCGCTRTAARSTPERLRRSSGRRPSPARRAWCGTRTADDKIEEWTLPGGALRLEVSRTTSGSPKHETKFRKLVDRLRARGVKPLDESKTELGSRCPEANP